MFAIKSTARVQCCQRTASTVLCLAFKRLAPEKYYSLTIQLIWHKINLFWLFEIKWTNMINCYDSGIISNRKLPNSQIWELFCSKARTQLNTYLVCNCQHSQEERELEFLSIGDFCFLQHSSLPHRDTAHTLGIVWMFSWVILFSIAKVKKKTNSLFIVLQTGKYSGYPAI